jgi:DHHC palmitoyltransferase
MLCAYIYWTEILPTITILRPLQGYCFVHLVTLILFNYYMAIMTSPGSPKPFDSNAVRDDAADAAELLEMGQELQTCRFCLTLKPPRSHHCQLCKKCILKMDHRKFQLT